RERDRRSPQSPRHRRSGGDPAGAGSAGGRHPRRSARGGDRRRAAARARRGDRPGARRRHGGAPARGGPPSRPPPDPPPARGAATLRAGQLILGEVMGPELAELVMVASRGQEGLVAALPGRSAGGTLTRLTAFAAAGLGATPATAAALLVGAFDLVVHVVAV